MAATSDTVGERAPSALVEPALVGVLFLASTGTVQQYAGLGGVLGYLLGLALAVPFVVRVIVPEALRRVDERTALLLAAGTLIVLVVLLVIVYPIANRHGGNVGSDRDDAADIATRQLFHLHYPYSVPTYLGNRVTQLPGGLLLDAPFVALGGSAYQNPLWFLIFFLTLRWWLRDTRLALLASWTMLLGSPALLREYLNGGDVIANTISVTVLAIAVLKLDRRALRLGAAALLGLALSWRPNFLFWTPLLFVALARRERLRSAIVHVGVALAVFATVTLPFYLYDRAGFSPLSVAGKVTRYDGVLPHSDVAVLAATVLLVLALCRFVSGRLRPLLASMTLVQAFLACVVVVLASLHERRPQFMPLEIGFGLFFLLPSAFVLWGPAPE